MSLYIARIAAGLIAGFLAGLVSYLLYRKYEEAHELLKRLVYRPIGLPDEGQMFRKRSYLLIMSITGMIFGFVFEALRMHRFLKQLTVRMQDLAFFAFSICLSVAVFQIFLHWKMKDASKKVMEQWLILGLVFGFFLGLFFNLISFFVIGPLLL
ncbi:MAG: hypothetical protein ACLFQ8_00640 [Candidatus Aenigmatarchaeota archaeon]